MTPDTVIDFWLAARECRWFTRVAAFDGELSVRFKEPLAMARDGAFDHWAETPKGTLALIILLDQFSRNIHRGEARAFAQDDYARECAEEAIERGDDLGMLPVERQFLYLPFEHSERLHDQERALELFVTLEAFDETRGLLEWARRHHAIVARFGRFPHRNAILGRASTAAEVAFLAEPGSGF